MKENKLIEAGIEIKAIKKNDGYCIQIDRNGKLFTLDKVYTNTKQLDRAILNAIRYELKKL